MDARIAAIDRREHRWIVADLDERFAGLMIEQDALAETWSGAAATAAATRVVQEKSLGGAVAGALSDLAEQYRGTAGIVDGARSHLVSVVSDARGRGFNVEDDGWVDPAALIAWLALAPEHTRDAARLRIEKEAAELTLVVVDALRQARDAAIDAANRIQAQSTHCNRRGRPRCRAMWSTTVTEGSPWCPTGRRPSPHRRSG
ncbi:hypothetical protein [Rhodococcus sp. NPDC049939]|uniref:hypothetical protein n=1 Tax=Rhodococcus sp. NPDC049939 TaxID=3155511 RepID=UPI0033CFB7DF